MSIRKFQSVTKGHNLTDTMAMAIASHVELLDEDSSEVARKECSRLSIVLTEWNDAQEALFG